MAGQVRSWVLPLLTVALASPSSAAAQDWLATDWTVECLTVNEGTCTATEAAGANTYFAGTLEEASQWLKGLGFRGPKIEHRESIDSYIAYISDVDNEGGEGSPDTIGVYYPDLEQIYLTSDRYFAMGEGDTPQERALDLAYDIEDTATVVHELFHGVQYGYPRFGNPVPDWITEGMADAVQLAWVRRTMPGVRMRGGTRAFDHPLHKPKDDSDAYNTDRFWRGIGKILGSRDDIGYLHTILQKDLASGSGLGGVDEGLREIDPEGLYNLYPEFIARHTNNAYFFDDIGQVSLVYDDSSSVEKSVQGTVREVAADAHEVSVHVPAWETAELEIRLANDHDDLHLVVDSERLDESAGPGRNVFHATVEGGGDARTFFVRVANVARKAVDTGARHYNLEFTLTPTVGESRCTFTATMRIEPVGPHRYVVEDGKKVPIRRTESVVGVATISDRHDVLALSTRDSEKGPGTRLFVIDISPLGIGGPSGQVSTRSDVGFGSPVEGDYDVQLNIADNADPGDLAGWDEMTVAEQIDSGVGYPNRLAMRRLRGKFRATRMGAPECCVGYVQTISGTFDAGNGPYHCEGGLEAMKKGYEIMRDMFNEMPGRKVDPSKLDGLLD